MQEFLNNFDWILSKNDSSSVQNMNYIAPCEVKNFIAILVQDLIIDLKSGQVMLKV